MGMGRISTRNFAILLYKTRVEGTIVFFMFSFFFEHIYHDEMRGNYIMENEKNNDHISERRQDERVVKYI